MLVGVRNSHGRFVQSFDILVKLPWNAIITLVVQHDMTVTELKSLIEFSAGIPSQLISLSFGAHHTLNENDTLRDVRIIQGIRLTATILRGYEELVTAAIKGNSEKTRAEIKCHHNLDEVAFRQWVALFISAHKGYHFLVNKLLTDGANCAFSTPSLRTPLHVACAMGNSACVDALLQFKAPLTVKDVNGQTPVQVAFSCGQQEAERKILLFQRAKSREKRFVGVHHPNSSWTKSPRFPASRLARSVTPILALRELTYQPGPELTVRPLDESKRPSKNKRGVSDVESTNDSENDRAESLQTTCELDDCLSERRESIASDASSSTTTERRLVQSPMGSTVSSDSPNGQQVINVMVPRLRPRTAPPLRRKKTPSPHSAERSEEDIDADEDDLTISDNDASSRDAFGGQDNVGSTLSGFEHKSTHPSNFSMQKRHLQSKTPLYYFSYMKPSSPEYEKFSRLWVTQNHREVYNVNRKKVGLRPSTAPPDLDRRRKATPEENEAAFHEWVANKMQGARDARLVNNVQMMLDQAFGRQSVDRRKVIDVTDEDVSMRRRLNFEEWKDKKRKESLAARKKSQDNLKSDNQINVSSPNQKTEIKGDLSKWFKEKKKEEIRLQAEEKKAAKERGEKWNEKQRKDSMAQEAFDAWRMQKEWEELENLRKVDSTAARDYRNRQTKFTKLRKQRLAPHLR